jgi:CBS domain-containing membrane protein
MNYVAFGLMELIKAPHPRAGVTTLIFPIGALLHTFEHLVILMAAGVVLTVQAVFINRLVGLPCPLRAPLSSSLQ